MSGVLPKGYLASTVTLLKGQKDKEYKKIKNSGIHHDMRERGLSKEFKIKTLSGVFFDK